MGSESRRPLGVTVLSFFALVTSIGLFLIAALAIRSLFAARDLPVVTVRFSSALWEIGLLLLSWSALVVGRDLWCLRPRERSLTIAAMILFFLYGVSLSFMAGVFGLGPFRESMTAIARVICSFSSIAALYLFIPSVKRRFRPSAVPLLP